MQKSNSFPETNEILVKRCLVSLQLLFLIRIGNFIPVPNIDPEYPTSFLKNSSTIPFLNAFSSDEPFVIGLFTLNIIPYINASILMQFLVTIIPSLQAYQKEQGAAGRRKITKITRYLSLGFAFIESGSIALFLKNILFNWNYQIAFEIVLWLTTGSMIVMWFSELITEYGVGNGPSLLIFTNIISSIPKFFKTLFVQNLDYSSLFIVALLFCISLYGTVFLQDGVRNIKITTSKQLLQRKKLMSDPSQNIYIPFRVNQAGVMPLVFTTVVLVLPNYILNSGILPNESIPFFLESYQYLYWVAYFTLILAFSYFYSTLILNPKDISEDLRKQAAIIKEVRPGAATTFYLEQTLKRITFIGAIILAIISMLPNLIENIFHISNLKGLGTTSLLILVGVTFDTAREIRAVIISNIYKSRLVENKENNKY